jgi:NADPH:quinone reductase-like Zn-dependent oxidoreductase
MDLNRIKEMVDVVLSSDKVETYGKALQDALTASGETHQNFLKDLGEALAANPIRVKLAEGDLVKLINRLPALKRSEKYDQIMKHLTEDQKKQITAALARFPMLAAISAEADVEKLWEVWIKPPFPGVMEVDSKHATKQEAEQAMAQRLESHPDWKIWVDNTKSRNKMAKLGFGEGDDSGYFE